jgi:hypothetical protein
MSKQKRMAEDETATDIILLVERVLAAGRQLRAALQAEGWINQASQTFESPEALERWRDARAATGQAEAEYRKALGSVTDGSRVRRAGRGGSAWSPVPIRKTS